MPIEYEGHRNRRHAEKTGGSEIEDMPKRRGVAKKGQYERRSRGIKEERCQKKSVGNSKSHSRYDLNSTIHINIHERSSTTEYLELI